MKKLSVVLLSVACLGAVSFASLRTTNKKSNKEQKIEKKQKEVKKDCKRICPFS